MTSQATIESQILRAVHDNGCIEDTGDFAKAIGVEDHNELVGVMKSLESYDMILVEV